MNYPSKAAVEARRARYKPGARVEMVFMNDLYAHIPAGTLGTVSCVDDTGTVFVKWDDGSALGAVYGEDEIKIAPRRTRIDDVVIEQITTIRDEAQTNMFNAVTVQRLAFEHEFYELVDFIETDRKAYAHFILTGNPEVETSG